MENGDGVKETISYFPASINPIILSDRTLILASFLVASLRDHFPILLEVRGTIRIIFWPMHSYLKCHVGLRQCSVNIKGARPSPLSLV